MTDWFRKTLILNTTYQEFVSFKVLSSKGDDDVMGGLCEYGMRKELVFFNGEWKGPLDNIGYEF